MVIVIPIVSTILKGIEFLSKVGNENQRLQGEIMGLLRQLKLEVFMAEWDMVKYEDVDPGLTLQMEELLYDIEDFICVLSIPEKPAAVVHSVAGMDSRPEDIQLIRTFIDSIKSIKEKQEKSSAGGNATPSSSSSALPPPSYAPEQDLLGFHKTKDDFQKLLSPSYADHAGKVISIVGCRGVGKTALARAVYEAHVVESSPPAASGGASPFAMPGQRLLASLVARATYWAVPPAATEVTEVHEETNAASADHGGATPFHSKAWVVASRCNDADDLLSEVLKEVDPTAAGEQNTSEYLQKFLKNRRYLVIIDDLQPHGIQWKDIEHVFPKNHMDSRIIVTTSVHSIARECSSGSYFVYPMQCLGEPISKGLIWEKFNGTLPQRSPFVPEDDRLKQIAAKCDGLPLALISAGDYFRLKGEPILREDLCEDVCEELGNIVASDERAFGEMKRMLVQCYQSLADNDCRNCLLYLSIFPHGHQINCKSVVRWLKAEELVAGDVLKCLEKLIDRSMLEPAPVRNNSNRAKRCQLQGIMPEFTIHKSVSKNLVTLVDEDKVRLVRPNGQGRPQRTSLRTRRLIVQSPKGRNPIPEGIERLSNVRSLMIFTSKLLETRVRVNAVDFKSCKLMRILDLEGCQGLNKGSTVLDDICELLFLNYLSLKSTDADELPRKIKNLKRLETLDIRQTRVAILPVEVIMLPELAHIFGEFELPLLNGQDREALEKFMKYKSKLHTLSGLVINKTRGFKTVLCHARNLKKVKICGKSGTSVGTSGRTLAAGGSRFLSLVGCARCFRPNPSLDVGFAPHPTTPSRSVEAKRLVGVLVSTLQKRFQDLKYISIDSSVISKAFLASLKAPCNIRSMKLRGALTSLPRTTLKDLRNLNKLHLISTGLRIEQLVEDLQGLDCLEYLKLGQYDSHGPWDGDFSVQDGAFPALQELCFEVPEMHPRLKIEEGAMTCLTTLQLLCPHLKAMRVQGIEHLKYLDEVILHHTAQGPIVEAWKETAKKHSNMPSVNMLPN